MILLAVNAGLLLAALMGLGMLGAALWLVLGPGPQRNRAITKARRLLCNCFSACPQRNAMLWANAEEVWWHSNFPGQ